MSLTPRLDILQTGGGRPVVPRLRCSARKPGRGIGLCQRRTPSSNGGRTASGATAAVQCNWYLNPQTIIMVNYVWTHLDSVVAGASGNLQGVGIRFHFDF